MYMYIYYRLHKAQAVQVVTGWKLSQIVCPKAALKLRVRQSHLQLRSDSNVHSMALCACTLCCCVVVYTYM